MAVPIWFIDTAVSVLAPLSLYLVFAPPFCSLLLPSPLSYAFCFLLSHIVFHEQLLGSRCHCRCLIISVSGDCVAPSYCSVISSFFRLLPQLRCSHLRTPFRTSVLSVPLVIRSLVTRFVQLLRIPFLAVFLLIRGHFLLTYCV